MFRPLGLLTRFTSSTLRYASENALLIFSVPPQDSNEHPSQQKLELWLAEMQLGVDAFFDDKVDTALEIFKRHAIECPYHAFGYAMLAYVDFMLGYEPEKLQDAVDRIADAEALARRFAQKKRKRPQHHSKTDRSVSSASYRKYAWADSDMPGGTPASFAAGKATGTKKKGEIRPDLQYDLLVTNCMLMSSTMQFLGDGWVGYVKAAYKLRKAYKMISNIFETVTGHTPDEYALLLQEATKKSQRHAALSQANNDDARTLSSEQPSSTRSNRICESRFNRLFHISHPSSITSTPLSSHALSTRLKFSSQESTQHIFDDDNIDSKSGVPTTNSTIESGAFFAVGLFSLIFSLMPPKVSKMLNTFGFHSSRSLAVLLLQKSYDSQGLYSSFSALALLAYYSNLSLFIHPRLSPGTLNIDMMQGVLIQMKYKYPEGRIWKFIEGKMLKMQGQTQLGVNMLSDAHKKKTKELQYERKCSTTGKVDKQCGLDQSFGKYDTSISQLPQFQAMATYEIGWGQIIMGDYVQATETFFRLESMSSCSRIFHHYIAACCIFAANQYDKAALEFLQLPLLLNQRRSTGRPLLLNEIYVEQRIRLWNLPSTLTGDQLKQMLTVNPLWELVYLWNGHCQLSIETLENMKQMLDEKMKSISTLRSSSTALLHLLFGSVVRELGDYQLAEIHFRKSLQSAGMLYDSWVKPYAMYEIAVLICFRQANAQLLKDVRRYANEARDWIKRTEHFLITRRNNPTLSTVDSTEVVDCDWEIKLQVRCQFLLEKLDDCSLQ